VEEGVPVVTGAIARVDVVLAVGALTEAITVQSERTLLQTDSGQLYAELDSEEVTSLPLGSYRNYQSLLNLVPGAVPARGQNSITDTPARSLTTQVNGTARNNNNTRLDGAVTVFVWLPHHAVYVAPAETVETVNMQTTNFDAGTGFTGGASINVLTKSGSNEFHGSGFYMFENDSLRARDWANSGDKPEHKRQIYGGTLGGPIIKDKLFFFGGYEGHLTTLPQTRTGTMPTAAMRAGDFSAFGTTIYDPATGNPDGTGRTPFPNNIIPADRIDSIAADIQGRIPMPNRDGLTSNYVDSGTTEFDRKNFDDKLNWNVSNNLQLWGKYSQMNALVVPDMWLGHPAEGGIGGSSWNNAPGEGDTQVKVGTFGWTWTVSPTFVIDGNAGYARFDQTSIPPDFGTNYGTDILGIPGTNGDGGAFGDPRTSGIPRFSISSFTTYGNPDGWTPLFRNDRTYNFTANATYIKGSHEMRFGFDLARLTLDHWQPELGDGPRGRLDFNGGPTALAPEGSPDQFNAYAAFLLGQATTSGKSLQTTNFVGKEWQYALFFRDNWQVNRKLTLNLGIRWEKYPLMQREEWGLEYYDESTNEIVLCGLGGTPSDCGIEVSHPNFLPRLGFSYRMTDDDVLRGGYGITVAPSPFTRPLRGFFPTVDAQNFPAETAFIPGTTLAEGIPLFFPSDVSGGRLEVPTTATMGSPYADKINRAYIQSWNLTYERRLPWDISLATSYVGTKTTHQIGFRDINSAGPGEGQSGKPLFAPFGRTAQLLRFDGQRSGNYHSLQMALNKPFSKGLFLKGAYTWSKAMNRTDDDGWSGVDYDHGDYLSRNYSRAGYMRAHVFQIGWVWEMPFGRDSEGALAAIVKDWALNGVFYAFTGRPFGLSSSGASVNAPGNNQDPDQISDPVKTGDIGSGTPYYETSSWVPVTEVRFGNTARNPGGIAGPGWMNLDLGLFRRFPVGDKVNLEFRAEAFNLTNTPHFNNPNGNVNSSGFMTVTSVDGRNAPNRQFRLGIRLQF
jgi:hypothetical protein